MNEKYATALEVARAVARDHGYAIGLHGSTQRDLDLIACPWIDNAADPDDLAYAIAFAVYKAIGEGWMRLRLRRAEDEQMTHVEEKPHGRRAYIILLRDGQYIDLSVMPRVAIQTTINFQCDSIVITKEAEPTCPQQPPAPQPENIQ